MTISHRALGILLLGIGTGASLLAGAQNQTPVRRTIYLVATDPSGAHVSGLTAADLTVKEGGKEREILAVAPSRDRLKVALAVAELLSADSLVRRAVLRFVSQIQGSGELALYLAGRRTEKRVDYSSEFALFLNAVNAFPNRPTYQGDLVECVFEMAKEQRAQEGRRAIVTMTADIRQTSNVTADGVLDQLRDTGAVFYAATIAVAPNGTGGLQESPITRLEGGDVTQEVEMGRVLSNGTKQSGGLRLSTLRVEGFTPVLDRIAGELLHQYSVTYVLPSGTKSDGRLSVTAKRKGVTVRGPNLVPKV